MKKGFTLVELSIVLVIIGLLIGGILVAQSLIDSTKLQNFVRTVQQYETSIHLFRERYRRFPGDSSIIVPTGTGTHTGDNDWNLETSNVLFFDDEAANFWPALQIGIKLDKDPTYIMDASAGIRHGQNVGSHVPNIDIGSGAGLVPRPAAAPDTWGFHVGNWNASSNAAYGGVNPFFANPVTVLAIDTKMDDGAANTGLVIDGGTPAATDTCSLTGSPTVYEVSDGDEICSLYVNMFTTLEN